MDDDDEIVALLLADVAPLDLEIAECDQEDVSALLASDALRFVGDATSGFGEASDADSAFPALSAPEAQSNGDQQKPRTLLPAGAAGIQSTSAPLFVVYATASGKVETRGRKKQKPDAVVNRYRDRRREELTYLRRKVKELDHELQALQQRQQAMSAVSASTPPETGNADNATVKSLWQRIASTQKQSAQHARQENEQLRSAVEEQIKTAKMLQRVLAKKLNVAVRVCVCMIHGLCVVSLLRSARLCCGFFSLTLPTRVLMWTDLRAIATHVSLLRRLWQRQS